MIGKWPQLCILAMEGTKMVGAIVSKFVHEKQTRGKSGNIAILAVDEIYRRKRIGKILREM